MNKATYKFHYRIMRATVGIRNKPTNAILADSLVDKDFIQKLFVLKYCYNPQQA